MRQQSWKTLAIRSLHSSPRYSHPTTKPIIQISNGTFYRHHPSAHYLANSNPPLLSNLTFTLPSHKSPTKPQIWAVISPSSLARTTFLQILAGRHICVTPTCRTYPHLSSLSLSPHQAIKYVGFDAERGNNVGGTSVRGAYLSARYESRREETDFSLTEYLTGRTELNALPSALSEADGSLLDEVTEQLNLRPLLGMPVANLSNGQTRRARIGKALMGRPEILLLDGPFMGLDPNTLRVMSKVLRVMAERQRLRLVVSLRPEDGVPEWVSHLVIMDGARRVMAQGSRGELSALRADNAMATSATEILRTAERAASSQSSIQVSRDGFHRDSPALEPGVALVEMNGVKVAYGDKVVLGDWTETRETTQRTGLWWSLRAGQRCAILGPNGSGKTTMLSLITSDHPQTYSLPIKLFGRSRLPLRGEPGISLFDIQRRMGHSSPEVHAFFPKQVTVRRALESAWADAPLAKPKFTDPTLSRGRVDACLRWFEKELNPKAANLPFVEAIEGAVDEETARAQYDDLIAEHDLNWASELSFRDLSFSNQRLILFLRALVSTPDLVILDEALSGIDETLRDKALLFLSQGESMIKDMKRDIRKSMHSRIGAVAMSGLGEEQALLVISHVKEDVPGCVREWIRLPEPGEGRGPKVGTLGGPLELRAEAWEEIWR
ncbi:hypothetical protein LTR62_006033 [Meristemomyces frigidus]|uniref:ABC transporter domain-containing protein n=1 Tax=Meristemomyces frigidus TaxID=1508187 RepID=A0AAN7TQS8_9PEZI|nr:hypothetical protein LTR62_006033 [Meristemomyces frigidus]